MGNLKKFISESKKLVLVFTLSFSSSVLALIPIKSGHNSAKQNCGGHNPVIEKLPIDNAVLNGKPDYAALKEDVIWIDPVDNRDFMSVNAASVDRVKQITLFEGEMSRFTKTAGHWRCLDKSGKSEVLASADLINSNQEIAVPLHAFDEANLKTCSFTNYVNQSAKVEISAQDKKKYKTWIANGRPDGEDKIRLQLSHPIDGAEPFPILEDGFKINRKTEFLVVSGFQDDWNGPRGIGFKDMKEPLAYKCSPKDFSDNMKSVLTRCASGSGASGAKVYVRTPSGLKTYAMIKGARNTDAVTGEQVENGSGYDPDRLFSKAVILDTSFISTQVAAKK